MENKIRSNISRVMSRLKAMLLILVMLFSITPHHQAMAASSYKVGKTTVTDTFVKHKEANCSKTLGSGKHSCCWYYASAAYKKIWGKSFNRTNTKTNLLQNLSAAERKMTAANLEKFFSQTKPGAVFRMSGNKNAMGTPDDVGHSMIFIKKGSQGAYFWEGNYDGKGGTRIYFWTWNKLVSHYGKKYPYVKYIAWPDAPKLVMRLDSPKLTVANGANGVVCAWQQVKNATGYIIYRSGKTICQLSSGSTTSYTDKNVQNGKEYVYSIVAVNNSITSDKSSQKKIVYLSVPKLMSVSNPASKLIKENHLYVTWSRNSEATGYEIQISSDKNFLNARTLKVSSAKQTSYTVKDAALGKFYVRIRTVKNGSYSEWSSSKSVSISR